MNAPGPQAPPAKPSKAAKARRGVVIVAVLLVVTMLSLAAYQYGDLMLAEAKVAENAHRAAQAKAFADGGIHYAMALLSNQDNFSSVLNANPYNNPQAFQNILIQGDNGVTGRFSIICPPDPASGTTDLSYGVMDECGKINLAAWMKVDPTGQLLHDSLVKLPNMTEELANNIIAWMGGSVGIQNGGAQDDYYSSQKPAYRAKNSVPDSLDELLLVKGVTRDLLYGADADRNGVQNGNEPANTSSTTPPGGGFDRGWSAFLTVHSREQNSDPLTGKPYINLNDPDLQQLYNALSVEVSDDFAKFIILFRQYRGTKASGTVVTDMIGNYQPQYTKSGNYKLTSFFDLLSVTIYVPSPDKKDAKGNSVTLAYASPISELANQRDLLPKLFAVATLSAAAELPAAVNINTAPPEVLAALPYLADTDVQKIVQMRQSGDVLGEIFQTPTWLLTDAQINPVALQRLSSGFVMPDGTYASMITTRSQVYRVQSVGSFDGGKGPSARVEAVIDTNGGRPRILAWRNLSDLGKGMTDPNMSGKADANANPNP